MSFLFALPEIAAEAGAAGAETAGAAGAAEATGAEIGREHV